MQWEFAPEDVVKARTDYGLTEFRRDLREEVRLNMDIADDGQLTRSFDLIYDLCYALATEKELDGFLAVHAYDPPTVEFLRGLAPMMADNVAMLGAILQRAIMDRIESGMALPEAIHAVADWHAALTVLTTPAGVAASALAAT